MNARPSPSAAGQSGAFTAENAVDAGTFAAMRRYAFWSPICPSTDALIPLLRRIDETRWYTNGGPLVREYEARVALVDRRRRFAGRVHCNVVGNGGARAGARRSRPAARTARVLVPAYTFPATANAVIRNGACSRAVRCLPRRDGRWSPTLRKTLRRASSLRRGRARGRPRLLDACREVGRVLRKPPGSRCSIDARGVAGERAFRAARRRRVQPSRHEAAGGRRRRHHRDRGIACWRARLRSALNHGFAANATHAERVERRPGPTRESASTLRHRARAACALARCSWPRRSELWRTYREALRAQPRNPRATRASTTRHAVLTVTTDRDAADVGAALHARWASRPGAGTTHRCTSIRRMQCSPSRVGAGGGRAARATRNRSTVSHAPVDSRRRARRERAGDAVTLRLLLLSGGSAVGQNILFSLAPWRDRAASRGHDQHRRRVGAVRVRQRASCSANDG